MAEDLKLNVILKVNKDTGQLEIVKQELAGVEESAKKAGDKSGELLGNLKSLLPAFSALAVVKFLGDAVKEAEAGNEALRRLKFQLEASGESWNKNEQTILKWASTIQSSTRFADGQAYEALGKLIRVTGNLSQAQILSKLAMDISVATGKDLTGTVEQLSLAYQNNSRGILQLRREFSAQLGELRDGTSILNRLVELYGKAAEKEDSYTKTVAEAKHHWSDFIKLLGQQVLPIVNLVVDGLNRLMGGGKKEEVTAEKLKDLAGRIKYLKQQIEEIEKERGRGLLGDVNIAQLKAQLDEAAKLYIEWDKKLKEKKPQVEVKAAIDIEAEAKHLENKTKLFETWLKSGLDQENLNYQQREMMINAYEGSILAIIDEKKNKGIISEQEAADTKAQLTAGVLQLKQDASQQEIQIEMQKAQTLAGLDRSNIQNRFALINLQTNKMREQGMNEVAVNKWANKEKIKTVLDATKEYVDIQGATNQAIDSLVSANAQQQKYAAYDILAAQLTTLAKRMAMEALAFAVIGNFVSAAGALAVAVAAGAAAKQINIKKQQMQEEDRIEEEKKKTKEAEEKKKADEEERRKKEAQEKAEKESEFNINAKKEVSTFSERSEVTRTEQVVRIDVGGIEINIANVTTDQIDIDKVMRDIGYKVQSKTLEAIQMAMRIYNTGKANEGLA